MSRRFTGRRLVAATHNRGKLEEIAALLAPYPVEVVAAGDLGLPEPAETEARDNWKTLAAVLAAYDSAAGGQAVEVAREGP